MEPQDSLKISLSRGKDSAKTAKSSQKLLHFGQLDNHDWYGITYDGSPHGVYEPSDRLVDLYSAKQCGIRTWASCEPVVNPAAVLDMLTECHDFIDKVKIGKLNYHKANIDWKKSGQDTERLCLDLGLDYYIKDSLRKEMED